MLFTLKTFCLLLWLLVCLNNAVTSTTAAFEFKPLDLESGIMVPIQCDHTTPEGATVVGLDLWWLTYDNKIIKAASIEDNKWTAYPPFTKNQVTGLQFGGLNLLTLSIENPQKENLGGYICSLHYLDSTGKHRTAVVDYVNFVEKGLFV